MACTCIGQLAQELTIFLLLVYIAAKDIAQKDITLLATLVVLQQSPDKPCHKIHTIHVRASHSHNHVFHWQLVMHFTCCMRSPFLDLRAELRDWLPLDTTSCKGTVRVPSSLHKADREWGIFQWITISALKWCSTSTTTAGSLEHRSTSRQLTCYCAVSRGRTLQLPVTLSPRVQLGLSTWASEKEQGIHGVLYFIYTRAKEYQTHLIPLWIQIIVNDLRLFLFSCNETQTRL